MSTRSSRRPGMLSASVAEGYPYADVAEMGMAFLAISDGDAAAAREAARWMARRAWDRRAEFVADDTLTLTDALQYAAMRAPEGSGRADGRRRQHRRRQPGRFDLSCSKPPSASACAAILQTLRDPEAVAALHRGRVGAAVTLAVGGKTDDLHGRRSPSRGTVRRISDGKFEEPDAHPWWLSLLRRRHRRPSWRPRRAHAGPDHAS